LGLKKPQARKLARAAGWPGQVSGKFRKKESADFGTIFFFLSSSSSSSSFCSRDFYHPPA
jgi:hypothetical protein